MLGISVSHPKINADGGYVVARKESAVPESSQEAGFPDTAVTQQHHLCFIKFFVKMVAKAQRKQVNCTSKRLLLAGTRICDRSR